MVFRVYFKVIMRLNDNTLTYQSLYAHARVNIRTLIFCQPDTFIVSTLKPCLHLVLTILISTQHVKGINPSPVHVDNVITPPVYMHWHITVL